jgi:hypothetical protein
MAKAKSNTVTVTPIVTDWTDHVFKLPSGNSVIGRDLTNAAIVYSLQYGLTQSCQDAVAGRAKELRTEGKLSADEIAATVYDEMNERFAAIQAGTVGHRAGGPRVSPVESVMRKVALEDMRAGAAKHGRKLPKGDALADLVSQYVAKASDTLRVRAEARMAESNASADSAGDLLSAIGL